MRDAQSPKRVWQRFVEPIGAGSSSPTFAIVIAVALLAHLAFWWVSEPPTLFSDFYKAYFVAGEYLWENGITAPWPFTESGAGGFVNLPIIAWAFVPFVPLGETAAGWAFLALGVVAVLVLTLQLVALADARRQPAVALAIAVLVAVNGPMVNSLREGNTTHFILLLLVTAVLLLRRDRQLVAGALLGFCAVLKLPLLLLLAYLAWRRQWPALAGAGLSIAGLGIASLLAFGIEAHLDWFSTCVLPFLGGVIPAFNVQSIDGFIVRLDTGAAKLRIWDPMQRSTLQAVVRFAIVGVIAAAALLVFHRPSPRARAGGVSVRDRELELATILLIAIIISPVSWTHYYLLALMPWALMIGPLMSGSMTRLQRRLMIASIVLISLPVVDIPEALSPWLREVLARSAISAWLFGGLAALAALLIERWRSATPMPSPQHGDRTVAEAGA